MRQGLFTYPWDVLDGDADRVCGEIADAGFQTLNLATQYHAGKFLLPRNPRRRVYFPEDGAVYFTPDLGRYGRLKPRVHSTTDAQGSPIDRILPAMERHGLTYTAWTVCLHNSWLGERHPECCLTTAYGDPLIHSLSPGHPDVQDYVVNVVRDLASRYPVTDIQLESPGYMGFTHGFHHEIIGMNLTDAQEAALALSFSDAELAGATDAGVDAVRARDLTADWLDRSWNAAADDVLFAHEDVVAYRDWMWSAERTLLGRVRQVAKETNPDVRLWQFAALDGSDRDAALIEAGDGILCGYAGSDADARDRSARAAAFGKPFRGALRAIAPDTIDPGTIAPRVTAWAESGVEGIDVYNYGFMTRPLWDAVGAAMRERTTR